MAKKTKRSAVTREPLSRPRPRSKSTGSSSSGASGDEELLAFDREWERLAREAGAPGGSIEDLKARKRAFFERRERLCARYMEELHYCGLAYLDGNLGALVDGLYFACEMDIETKWRRIDRKIPPLHPNQLVDVPRWVVEGLLSQLGDWIDVATTGKAGRHHRWRTQYREDMEDLERWQIVRWLRDREEPVPWNRVYLEAKDVLATRGKFTSADAIRRAYKSVQANMRTKSGRYRVAFALALQRVRPRS